MSELGKSLYGIVKGIEEKEIEIQDQLKDFAERRSNIAIRLLSRYADAVYQSGDSDSIEQLEAFIERSIGALYDKHQPSRKLDSDKKRSDKPKTRSSKKKSFVRDGERYIPNERAWKMFRIADRKYGFDVKSPSAYRRELVDYVESGKITAEGEGIGRRVRYSDVQRIIQEEVIAESDVKVPKKETKKIKKEKKESRYRELVEKMTGRNTESDLNRTLTEMNVSGKEYTGLRLAYVRLHSLTKDVSGPVSE